MAQEILCWDALSRDTVLKASRDLVWSPVKAFVCVVGIVIVCVNVVLCVSHSVREHAVAVGTQLLCVVSQTWWRGGRGAAGAEARRWCRS